MSKLVRDFVPAIVGASGGVLDVRGALDDDEVMRALDAKLVKEALEVGATAGREEALGELADLLGVLRERVRLLDITEAELEAAVDRKRRHANGFDARLISIRYVSPPTLDMADVQ
ncbi:nucleoside triphosphate pyrophosphohydrolase [Rathayibacter iranicus]|uniref:Phosphoribosyl-ATP pyrophosphohydrolase n=2 Tax=Rathayibacter iranicus TaxID=59737 RepID=A0AAD2JG28_9MICO|nr:nucleoside triphosphate pyrophosphohydrolase [Rathayibacter iranicus]AZZ54968.1 phosphoribosyl-ATP pyrophosphohydrolase [Rathayibacter iranicus]MWV32309.1 phosphoribosyl-ATP pyrophosphohydrolase [Rathayibacter iranicus NCPPB 2253 = VKM Ac-1602]PPI62352.1 phosphoribosyl-ATP pyrophosphohydrolase [Rathayibacter iranicus]PWJ61073.1 putative house-cleaning noncanonical NTP pyrophosphatase (MazG superfamily) [Rathayibacter iranicus NCPPB 2253 = VKM Ac-1602]